MRRLAFLSLLLATAYAPAAPLGDSLYPGLVEFDEAYALYSAGDFERARTGFRHLAELGDPEAQLNLGVMLAKGEGGPVDRIEGAAWVRLAEAGGLEQARAIRDVLEAGLEPAEIQDVAARLEAIEDTPVAVTSRPGSGWHAETERWACVFETIHRPEPDYPRGALMDGHVGMVRMEFTMDPDGTVGAVHSLYGLDWKDPFADVAWKAVTQWHAAACPGTFHRPYFQTIDFALSGEQGNYNRAQRREAARLLEAARAGDSAKRFGVALLAQRYPGLFDLEPEAAESLITAAAIQGLPEARHELSIEQGRAKAGRWLVLAARQGHPPALYGLSDSSSLPVAERKQALLDAARAAYEPAVYMAVRWLAAHPDPAQRDGILALQLTDDFWRGQLDGDLLLAQARAMALAETGQFEEAARLQERTLRTMRKSGRSTRLAEERLQAYEARQAWRDHTLVEDLGLSGND